MKIPTRQEQWNLLAEDRGEKWAKEREERRKKRFEEYEQWATEDAYQAAVRLITPPDYLPELRLKEIQKSREGEKVNKVEYIPLFRDKAT